MNPVKSYYGSFSIHYTKVVFQNLCSYFSDDYEELNQYYITHVLGQTVSTLACRRKQLNLSISKLIKNVFLDNKGARNRRHVANLW